METALFRELDRLEEVALPNEDTVDGDQSDSCYWLEQGMNRNRNG